MNKPFGKIQNIPLKLPQYRGHYECYAHSNLGPSGSILLQEITTTPAGPVPLGHIPGKFYERPSSLYVKLKATSLAEVFLTSVEFFFCESIFKLADRLSFQDHNVRLYSSAGTSEDDSMTAYVVQMCVPFSTVLRLTAGQENVVDGPRVCETTGCKLASWMRVRSERLVLFQSRTSSICMPSPCAATVTYPSELLEVRVWVTYMLDASVGLGRRLGRL